MTGEDAAMGPAGRRGRACVPFLRVVLAGAIIGGLVAGCDNDIFASISVRNNTSEILHFRIVRSDGVVTDIGPRALQPGQLGPLISGGLNSPSYLYKNRCTVGDVIALNEAGKEVARRPLPLCFDETWVVEPAPATSRASVNQTAEGPGRMATAE